MSKTYNEVLYNEVYQKSSHNSYNKGEGIYDQMIYWRIRSIEYDIHPGKTSQEKLDYDWYVYHIDIISPWTSVNTLADGLDVMAGFQKAFPDHEVITLLLCIKDDWSGTHMPDDLDKLLSDKLNFDEQSNIYTPQDLLRGATTTLQGSIQESGWPTLDALRGKFIILLTGSDLATANSVLNGYVGKDGKLAMNRTAFICPKTTAETEIGANNFTIFYNLPQDNMSLGAKVYEKGYVSRVYGSTAGIDTQELWDQAKANNIQLLATDQINAKKDPWSHTDNSKGWPFEGIGFTIDPEPVEAGLIYGYVVTSGDLDGKKDNFAFDYNQLSGSSLNKTYTMWVSSPGSEVDDFAKGGIMARASTADNAAYFGVFRTGEKRIRIQWREKTGDKTKTKDAPMPDNAVDQEDLIFIKLEVSGGGKTAKAWASVNVLSGWTEIGSFTFSDVLSYQGLAMSSHDDKDLKFFFGNVDGTAIAFSTLSKIGGATSAKFFEGVYDS